MTLVDEASTRRAVIGAAVTETAQTVLVPSDGSYVSRPVALLPIDLPIYRADNGRLAALQHEYLQSRGLGPSFFRDGQASDEVQRLIHEQLLKLAMDPAGPIYQELERTAVQTEALVATADGVVLNGNRRLAAMRDLFRRESQRYGGFERVRVAVLPEDISQAEIESIEATLQMAPETKLAYSWIARRLTMRRHRDFVGLTDAEIARSYRLPSPQRVRVELAELELAERYLAEYVAAPARYSAVLAADAFFIGLRRTLVSLNPTEAETWRLGGFAMLRHAVSLKISPEHYFPFAPPNPHYGPDMALTRFGNEHDLWPERDASGEVADLRERDHLALQKLLADSSSSRRWAASLKGHLDHVLSEHRQRQLTAPRELMKKAHHLNRQLAKLGPENIRDDERRQLLGALAETRFHADRLLGPESSLGLERRITDVTGWLYYVRRRALLRSKRRSSE